MAKVNFDSFYETFVEFKPGESNVELLRREVIPLVKELESEGIIDYFNFLIHDRAKHFDGNPGDVGYHVVVGLTPGKTKEDLDKRLRPRFIESIKRGVEHYSGCSNIERNILKDEEMENAWYVLGLLSKWVLGIFDSYKDEIEIPSGQITQHLHFLFNILQPILRGVGLADGALFFNYDGYVK